jgi:hypothetical protein
VADTTTQGHAEAVKAVAGALAPETPQEQAVEDGAIVVTRDLDSEQAKDEKLDKEITKAMGGTLNAVDRELGGEEREQLAVRTLANGKTEALLAKPAPVPPFPPDDGGYNPEKRQFAGPAGTKVPSAVGKNTPTVAGEPLPAGWKPEHVTAAGKKAGII